MDFEFFSNSSTRKASWSHKCFSIIKFFTDDHCKMHAAKQTGSQSPEISSAVTFSGFPLSQKHPLSLPILNTDSLLNTEYSGERQAFQRTEKMMWEHRGLLPSVPAAQVKSLLDCCSNTGAKRDRNFITVFSRVKSQTLCKSKNKIPLLVWSKYSLFILLQELMDIKWIKKQQDPEKTKGRIASYLAWC